MTLDDFMKLGAQERRQRFAEMSVQDQIEFVSTADPVILVLGGYPSEALILAAQVQSADGERDGQTLH